MKKYFFAVLICLLVTACSPKEYFLNGESNSWTGKIKVTNAGDYQELDFSLHYNGEDKNDVGDVTYHVEYNAGSFAGEEQGLGEGATILSGSRCTGCSGIKAGDVIVSVEWDEKTERFKLE